MKILISRQKIDVLPYKDPLVDIMKYSYQKFLPFSWREQRKKKVTSHLEIFRRGIWSHILSDISFFIQQMLELYEVYIVQFFLALMRELSLNLVHNLLFRHPLKYLVVLNILKCNSITGEKESWAQPLSSSSYISNPLGKRSMEQLME